MSAVLTHPEITLQRPDWLADDAVPIGPVSTPNSLLPGNLAGKFFEKAPSGSILRIKIPDASKAYRQILSSHEQGIFYSEQGEYRP